MHLHTVNTEAGASVELFMTNVALEVFRLLMLNENLFIVEFSIAVPAPWPRLLLLFSTHSSFVELVYSKTKQNHNIKLDSITLGGVEYY